MSLIKNTILLSSLYDSLSQDEVLFFQNKFHNFKKQKHQTSFIEKSVKHSCISIFPETINDFKVKLEENLELKKLFTKNKDFTKILERVLSNGLNSMDEFDNQMPAFTYTL